MATSADTAQPSPASADAGAPDGPFLTPARIRLLSIAAAVVAVVAVVVWFVITSGQRKEAFAAQALDQARTVAEQGNLADAVQQFERITESYGGTNAAHEATIGMAQARLVAGQTELAISTLESYTATNPPANYASPAWSLLGTGYENVKRFDDAAAAYRKAADLASIDYLKATLLLDAGRAAQLAGKSDLARQVYEQIVADFGDTPSRSEAEVRLAEITAAAAGGAAG
jgi:tetratricopeptide (TPR) repeat protein